MKRNNNKRTFRSLLQKIHSTKQVWHPDQMWRKGVMDEVASIHASIMAMELNRLAPRFALAAVAISAVSLIVATWSLHDLSGQLLAVVSHHTLQPSSLGIGI